MAWKSILMDFLTGNLPRVQLLDKTCAWHPKKLLNNFILDRIKMRGIRCCSLASIITGCWWTPNYVVLNVHGLTC